jgi:hypothetical protein
MNLPSVKTLSTVFGDNAREARRVLEMKRAALEATPAGSARVRECYNPPATSDIRMHALNALCDGACGVEAFQLNAGRRAGQWVEYLNTGDTYSATLLRVNGRYTVGCWGDLAERFTR